MYRFSGIRATYIALTGSEGKGGRGSRGEGKGGGVEGKGKGGGSGKEGKGRVKWRGGGTCGSIDGARSIDIRPRLDSKIINGNLHHTPNPTQHLVGEIMRGEAGHAFKMIGQPFSHARGDILYVDGLDTAGGSHVYLVTCRGQGLG